MTCLGEAPFVTTPAGSDEKENAVPAGGFFKDLLRTTQIQLQLSFNNIKKAGQSISRI